MKQAAMAAAAEFTWSNAALQYEAVFTELGVKDVLGGATVHFGGQKFGVLMLKTCVVFQQKKFVYFYSTNHQSVLHSFICETYRETCAQPLHRLRTRPDRHCDLGDRQTGLLDGRFRRSGCGLWVSSGPVAEKNLDVFFW